MEANTLQVRNANAGLSLAWAFAYHSDRYISGVTAEYPVLRICSLPCPGNHFSAVTRSEAQDVPIYHGTVSQPGTRNIHHVISDGWMVKYVGGSRMMYSYGLRKSLVCARFLLLEWLRSLEQANWMHEIVNAAGGNICFKVWFEDYWYAKLDVKRLIFLLLPQIEFSNFYACILRIIY